MVDDWIQSITLFRSDRRNDRLSAIIDSCPSTRDSIVKNITTTVLCLAASISSLSIAERSLAEPLQRRIAAPNSIARLKNGKYLACTKKKQPDVYDESQTCFEFVKQGTNIKGGYEVTQEGPVVCIIGTIKRNILTGSVDDNSVSSAANGVPFDEVEELRNKLPTSTPTVLTSHLQVAEGKLEILKVGKDIKDNPFDFSGKITYKKATLNVSNFQYISAVKKISYTDCLK